MSNKITLDDLKKYLYGNNIENKKKAIIVLSKINNPKVINLLKPLLDDENNEIKELVEKIISILSQKLNQKTPLLSDDHKDEIKNELLLSKDIFEKIKFSLESDDDNKHKIALLEAIDCTSDPQILNYLYNHLSLTDNEFIISTIIKILGNSNNLEYTEIIKKYLNFPNNRVISNAIDALITLGAKKDLLISILPLTNHSDNRIKISANQYIAKIEKRSLFEEIEKIIIDNEIDIILKETAIKLVLACDLELAIPFFMKIYGKLNQNYKSLIYSYYYSINSPYVNEFLNFMKYKNDITTDNVNKCTINDNVKNIFDVEKVAQASAAQNSQLNHSSLPSPTIINFNFLKTNKFIVSFIILTLLISFFFITNFHSSNQSKPLDKENDYDNVYVAVDEIKWRYSNYDNLWLPQTKLFVKNISKKTIKSLYIKIQYVNGGNFRVAYDGNETVYDLFPDTAMTVFNSSAAGLAGPDLPKNFAITWYVKIYFKTDYSADWNVGPIFKPDFFY